MALITNELSQIRRLDRSEIRLLWYADFWDGPINGLCTFDGRKCWFEMMDQEQDLPDAAGRHFLVVALASEQLAEEEHWHDLFRQKVGTHTDYGQQEAVVRPKELHREFYDPYKKRIKPNYSTNPVVGWFENA